jgi:DNA (cytosine-5)-methyltransferase 1
MTLGSLFDGIGGFPLAGVMCGITPVWASEIEPFPMKVTAARFPEMKQLGSVTDINGAEVEPVDIITFGSPCQDLSVAGKQLGIHEGQRSNLFFEAVRIIKEMRNADTANGRTGKHIRPRFAVWENVPGAFSSNKGEDFRIVLEEFIKIVEPTATMPAVPKNGWAYSDVYCGDGWSLAYRVLDAQYWGVPQRRRRIYLVADFRGGSAGKISFEREGLRGYFAESGSPRESTAGDAESGARAADREGIIPYTLKIRSGVSVDSAGKAAGKGPLIQENMSATLAVAQDQYLFQPVTLEPGIAAREGGHIYEGVCGTLRANAGDNQMAVVYSIENHPADSRVNIDDSGKVQTLTSRMGTGGGNVPMVMEPVAYNGENITSPLNKTNPQPGDPCHTLGTDSRNYLVYCLQGNGIDRADTAGCNGRGWNDEACYTLNTIDRPAVAYAEPVVLDRAFYNQGQNALYEPQYYDDGTVPTLVAKGPSAVAYWDGGQVCGTLTANNAGGSQRMPDKDNFNCVIEERNIRYIVRRLTPTECARLQGFPDAWGHPDTKDSLTEEEYAFWLEVRNTHAAINSKTVKDYTKAQMLTWYNKLHTDSSEYKLWGNGIALPCALYVMQGIADSLNGGSSND